MLRSDKQISFTYYSLLYDQLIPKDNFFRKLKENINFSFVNDILKESYCEKFGRPANEPEFMCKLLFLQRLKNFSDREVIEEVSYNLSYKFFLDMNPEDRPCDPSLLSKFRRKHIATEETLQKLLEGIVLQAIEKGLIGKETILMDATHTKSHAAKENNTLQLQRLTRNLRSALYKRYPEMKGHLPEKPPKGAGFQKELSYTKKLMKALDKENQEDWANKLTHEYRKVEEYLQMTKEAEQSFKKKEKEEDQKPKEPEEKRNPESIIDPDAKTGYKSEHNSFFGYKTHIAMSDSRIITGIKVTSGEAGDGKYLKELIERSRKSGMVIKEILGDRAYGGKENLEYLDTEGITPYIRLNPLVSEDQHKADHGMQYNKDADMMQCRAGNLSYKKQEHQNKGCNRNKRTIYYFDIQKCQECPYREGCYKAGAKTKTFSVTTKCEEHARQLEFQESEEFKERIKERYKIEAKNAEMKMKHGLEYCIYRGLFGMQVQSYLTAIAVNIKRIIQLIVKEEGENPVKMFCNISPVKIEMLLLKNMAAA